MNKLYKSQDRKYINRLSDVGDKYLFLLFVLLGAASIVSLKLAMISSQFIYPIPILLMILYALWCYFSPYFNLRLDKAGDNIYYLGFLYTLVSLGVSLYQASEIDGSQERIIANFGIALITTICGVAGRVFFTQLRDTPYEVEQETVNSLTLAASRLKGELDATLTDFNTFRTALQQSVNEWNVEWRSEREDQLKTTTACINENIGLVTQKNQEAATAIQNFTQDLGEVSNKLVNMNFSKDLLKEQLEPPINELQRFLKGIEQSFNDKLQKIDTSASGLVDFIEREKSFAHTVARLEEHSAKQIKISNNMMVDLTNHLGSFGFFVDSEGERLETQTNAMVGQIKRLTETYENLASQAEDKQKRFQISFGELGDKLTISHDALSGAVVQQTHLLKKMLIEDLEEYTKILPQRLKEINHSSTALSELTRKENFLAKTIDSLAEHTNQLITISRGNMSALTNDMDSFGKMVQLQSERIDQQINKTECYFNNITMLYENMATNTKASQQRFDGNVNHLSDKIQKSYSSLLNLVNYQDKFTRQFFQNKQQKIVPVNTKKVQQKTAKAGFTRNPTH